MSIKDGKLSLLNQQRIEVVCFNCGAEYVTRLLNNDKERPRRCKVCGSTQLGSKNRWRKLI